MTCRKSDLVRKEPHRISTGMIRPCFLVIDKQYPGSISARKLVIETALLNVITAYSAEEAIGTLERFSAVDGIVLDSEVKGMTCHEMIQRLRAIRPEVPIITVSPSGYDPCGEEDFHVSSYDPQDLLLQLNHICPKEIREAAEESDFPR
ncbi:MAG: response regulator [Acidobacteriota bacterium]